MKVREEGPAALRGKPPDAEDGAGAGAPAMHRRRGAKPRGAGGRLLDKSTARDGDGDAAPEFLDAEARRILRGLLERASLSSCFFFPMPDALLDARVHIRGLYRTLPTNRSGHPTQPSQPVHDTNKQFAGSRRRRRRALSQEIGPGPGRSASRSSGRGRRYSTFTDAQTGPQPPAAAAAATASSAASTRCSGSSSPCLSPGSPPRTGAAPAARSVETSFSGT